MAEYDATPAGAIRRAVADGTLELLGDPAKMAQAMIDSTEVTPAPRRLTLGSTSYTSIRAALETRLAELEAQKDVAFSTDF